MASHFLHDFPMNSVKNKSMEAENAFRSLQESVLHPLLDHFLTWECHPVDRIISKADLMKCYTFEIVVVNESVVFYSPSLIHEIRAMITIKNTYICRRRMWG